MDPPAQPASPALNAGDPTFVPRPPSTSGACPGSSAAASTSARSSARPPARSRAWSSAAPRGHCGTSSAPAPPPSALSPTALEPLVPIMGDWDGDGVKHPGHVQGGRLPAQQPERQRPRGRHHLHLRRPPGLPRGRRLGRQRQGRGGGVPQRNLAGALRHRRGGGQHPHLQLRPARLLAHGVAGGGGLGRRRHRRHRHLRAVHRHLEPAQHLRYRWPQHRPLRLHRRHRHPPARHRGRLGRRRRRHRRACATAPPGTSTTRTTPSVADVTFAFGGPTPAQEFPVVWGTP